MTVKITRHIVPMSMGDSYELKDIHTVGQLKKGLQEILDDLPDDDSLEVDECNFWQGKFTYGLRKGMPYDSN